MRKEDMRTKEQVYDEEINPLMARIIEICKEHKMAFVASFHCPGEDNDDLFCSSSLLGGEYPTPRNLLNAFDSITERNAQFAAFTITSKDKY